MVADVITEDGFVRDPKVSKRKPSEVDTAEELQRRNRRRAHGGRRARSADLPLRPG